MPLIDATGKRLFFAHVPKVGGSSVSDYLTRRFAGPPAMNDPAFLSGPGQRDTIVSPQHLTARSVAALLGPQVDHVFTVVRDPLARLLSQFRFQAGHARMTRLGFSTWARIVLTAARRDPRIYDNHLRPQSDIVPEGARVFRLEEGFDPMIAWLDQVTGSTAPAVAVGHLLKRESAPVPVTRQDAALVADFYRADYTRFGYDLPVPDDYPSDPRAGLRDITARLLAPPLVRAQHRKWLR